MGRGCNAGECHSLQSRAVITLDEWERGGSYSTIWAPLTERWRVITLDMLGFGFSAKPNAPYSILRQADLFEARLRELGIGEYHVLAHDYGDTVAQELLARKSVSPRILSMCFLNGGSGAGLRLCPRKYNDPRVAGERAPTRRRGNAKAPRR